MILFFPVSGTSTSFQTSGATLSGRDIITGALQRLNVIQANEVPSPEDLALGLTRLNELLDALNVERLMVPCVARATYALTANQSTRTIGPSGQLDGDRPTVIASAGVIPVGLTTEVPLTPLTRAQYASLVDKTLTNDWPTHALYEPTVPDGTFTFYPVPTTAATLVLYTPTLLSLFETANDSYAFAPGYARMLRENLALELAMDFNGSIPQGLQTLASETKAVVKRGNNTLTDMNLDPAVLSHCGVYNIYTDQ